MSSPFRSIHLSDIGVLFLLLCPFLCVAYSLNWLQSPILTFHWTDEAGYHWPAILRMAQQWPRVSLVDYSSATTPLFHLLFASLGKLIGFELARLRAINVLISVLAVFVLFRLWRKRFGLSAQSAAVLSLFFLFSPYFFGVSFLLLTDNLAWLLALLAIDQFMAASQTGKTKYWWAACIAVSLAVLTRQSLLWLVGVGFALSVMLPTTSVLRGIRIGALVLAAAPLVLLVWQWRGLVPPSFQHAHEAQSLLNVRALGFSLAVLGLYAPLLDSGRWAKALRHPTGWGWSALTLGCLYLLVFPVGSLPSDDGFIWRLSRSAPSVLGSSVLLWLLVPVGCMALVALLRTAWCSAGGMALVAFMVTAMASNLLYQKYFDPFIPLFVLLTRPHGKELKRAEVAVLLSLSAAFAVYAWLPYRAG